MKVRPKWWEYPDDVEVEILKAAPAMLTLLMELEARWFASGEANCLWCDQTAHHATDCPLGTLLDRLGRT